ncbi:putative MFS-type transporter [Colletotrichum tanaceti]|uniref:Putative MFS-type transporter n=1 Tax=Colletotrichum tanaceti TaxID=1306861 RepID=A0A4U6XL81_9PEZI|nr:putative MFS-type transporter [Colletotrichum tanaceti]
MSHQNYIPLAARREGLHAVGHGGGKNPQHKMTGTGHDGREWTRIGDLLNKPSKQPPPTMAVTATATATATAASSHQSAPPAAVTTDLDASTDVPLRSMASEKPTALTEATATGLDSGTASTDEAAVTDSDEAVHPSESDKDLPITAAAVIMTTLAGITFTSSLTTGFLVVALPKMAKDLAIPSGLLLCLTGGCSLLIVGTVADVVGSRIIFLAGCLLLVGSVLGSGLSNTPTQLIAFRGVQGIAASMLLPTAMSLLTLYFPVGKRRNLGFALVGAGQPTGYSVGLFLGGFFVDSIGWRYGWYLGACVAFVVFLSALFGMSKHPGDGVGPFTWDKMLLRIDWAGAVVASACLGMFSYVLAIVSDDGRRVREPTQIVLLSIAGALVPTFVWWMWRQEKLGKPALIPNSLWKTAAFSSICGMVFLTWAMIQSLEYVFSLFFQNVQDLSALQTSLRFIPNVLLGIIFSVALGVMLHRVPVYWIVLSTCLLSAISPLVMALVDPGWPYWYASFWAMLLSPLSGDTLFVVSALIITSTFPEGTQGLASAVFNTFSQFGTAVGLAVVGVISSAVSQSSQSGHHAGNDSEDYSKDDLLKGYRASFWAMFAAAALTCVLGALGLRKVSNKGLKAE